MCSKWKSSKENSHLSHWILHLGVNFIYIYYHILVAADRVRHFQTHDMMTYDETLLTTIIELFTFSILCLKREGGKKKKTNLNAKWQDNCVCAGGSGREQSVPAEQPFPADPLCGQPQHAARGPRWCQLHCGAGQQQRELQPHAQPSTVQVGTHPGSPPQTTRSCFNIVLHVTSASLINQ